MMSKNSMWLTLSTTMLMTLGISHNAQAITINYTDLVVGEEQIGAVAPGDNAGNPDGWDYYLFNIL